MKSHISYCKELLLLCTALQNCRRFFIDSTKFDNYVYAYNIVHYIGSGYNSKKHLTWVAKSNDNIFMFSS